MSALKPGKLYYRIGEVSQVTGVKPYVLRYWESEFRLMVPQNSTACLTTRPPIAGASVSLKAPRKALPIGVRAVETITASLAVIDLYLCMF